MNPNNLKSRRKPPDVRLIKKHSEIASAHSKQLVVGGPREKTATGYVVPGFQGKSFETFFATMLPGTSTDTMLNEKKDRTVRVLTGSLFVITDDNQRKLIAGEEAALERGTKYRLATANETVDLLICQGAKYDVSLTVVIADGASKDIPLELLAPPTLNTTQVGRRGSKAVEQTIASKRKTSSQVVSSVRQSQLPEAAGVVAGANARPTGGRFSEEGAG